MIKASLLNPLKEKIKDDIKNEEISTIFEAYYKRIYNYIYYRVNSHYLAEDLTSKVFEKIMLKINSYSKQKAPFEVWIFVVAKNVIYDYFRSQRRFKFFSMDSIKELISKEKNPEDLVLKEETSDYISKALKKLNSREQNIVALKFGGNLKNKEIAEILDITESNVGVILYRTMKKLKRAIESEGLR